MAVETSTSQYVIKLTYSLLSGGEPQDAISFLTSRLGQITDLDERFRLRIERGRIYQSQGNYVSARDDFSAVLETTDSRYEYGSEQHLIALNGLLDLIIK